MPTIASPAHSAFAAAGDLTKIGAVKSENAAQIRSSGRTTPKRRLLPDPDLQESPISTPSPLKRKSPRRSILASPNSPSNEIEKEFRDKLTRLRDSPGKGTSDAPIKKNLSDAFVASSKWNPRDAEQMSCVKEALHVSMSPPTIVCREDEQKRILNFCKACVEQEKAGSLYACGCPGTGKTLSMDKMRQLLVDWAKEAGYQLPDVLVISCTSLSKTTEIFTKILEKAQPQMKINGSILPLKHLQNLYSVNQHSASVKMMLLIVDELDYLITKDRAVLHDLFMLTTLPFARCILLGVANAIDLADRFLPRLRSLNCKPIVITFRAYSHDQILKILQQRLMAFPYATFQPRALELCARKVAAASGDMRKALSVCRTAVEILEAELREFTSNTDLTSLDNGCFDQQTSPAPACSIKQEMDVVRVDHMALALSKAFKSPIVDNIQSLPQHQQIVLCSTVKLFRGKRKDTTVGELNKSYLDICKSALISPVGYLEFSSMCTVLADQGLLKIGQMREDKLRRVTLKVDEADITFALQGVRFFRNCLQ